MLVARADFIADLTELAQQCAECFAMARCAGSDIKAIGLCAKAALILDADEAWLSVDATPFTEDRDYLEAIPGIRTAIRHHGVQVREVLKDAHWQAGEAAREMRAAMRERNWPRYYAALRDYLEATHAMDLCEDALSKLSRADRCLAWAPVRFAQVYEDPETFVAQGGRLPHEGRWIRAGHLTGAQS